VQLRAGHLRTIGTWRSTGAARMAGQTFRYQHRRSIRQHSGQRHRREQRGGTARWAITFEPEDLHRSGPPSKRAARLRQSRRIPRPEDAGPLPWMPFACPTSTPNRAEAMVEKIDPTRRGRSVPPEDVEHHLVNVTQEVACQNGSLGGVQPKGRCGGGQDAGRLWKFATRARLVLRMKL